MVEVLWTFNEKASSQFLFKWMENVVGHALLYFVKCFMHVNGRWIEQKNFMIISF